MTVLKWGHKIKTVTTEIHEHTEHDSCHQTVLSCVVHYFYITHSLVSLRLSLSLPTFSLPPGVRRILSEGVPYTLDWNRQ